MFRTPEHLNNLCSGCTGVRVYEFVQLDKNSCLMHYEFLVFMFRTVNT